MKATDWHTLQRVHGLSTHLWFPSCFRWALRLAEWVLVALRQNPFSSRERGSLSQSDGRPNVLPPLTLAIVRCLGPLRSGRCALVSSCKCGHAIHLTRFDSELAK